MNTNQVVCLQSALGIVLAVTLFLCFHVKVFRARDEFRLVKALFSAVAILALVWGFLLCGVFQGSFKETITAAFSWGSVSAEPWGTVGFFRILSVALGLSLLPWVLILLLLISS